MTTAIVSGLSTFAEYAVAQLGEMIDRGINNGPGSGNNSVAMWTHLLELRNTLALVLCNLPVMCGELRLAVARLDTYPALMFYERTRLMLEGATLPGGDGSRVQVDGLFLQFVPHALPLFGGGAQAMQFPADAMRPLSASDLLNERRETVRKLEAMSADSPSRAALAATFGSNPSNLPGVPPSLPLCVRIFVNRTRAVCAAKRDATPNHMGQCQHTRCQRVMLLHAADSSVCRNADEASARLTTFWFTAGWLCNIRYSGLLRSTLTPSDRYWFTLHLWRHYCQAGNVESAAHQQPQQPHSSTLHALMCCPTVNCFCSHACATQWKNTARRCLRRAVRLITDDCVCSRNASARNALDRALARNSTLAVELRRARSAHVERSGVDPSLIDKACTRIAVYANMDVGVLFLAAQVAEARTLRARQVRSLSVKVSNGVLPGECADWRDTEIAQRFAFVVRRTFQRVSSLDRCEKLPLVRDLLNPPAFLQALKLDETLREFF